MNMKNIYISIITVLFTSFLLSGCLSYKSAENYGDKQTNLGRYYTAAVAYEKAYTAKPTYQKAMKIAKTYTILKDYDNSKKWWEKVVSYSNASSDDYSNYVTAIYQSGSAGSYNIDSIVSVSNLNPNQFQEIKSKIAQVKNNASIKLVQEERFNQNNSAEAGIFSDSRDRFFISTNGPNKSQSVNVKKLRVDKSSRYSKEYLDFNNKSYFKIMIPQSGSKWAELGVDLKNVQQMGSFGLNEKDQMAFVTVFRNLDSYEKRNISLNSEIFYGRMDDNFKISNPKPFPLNAPFEYSVLTPFVDEVNKLLYFSSDMPGGKGGLDLYVVAYNDNYDFSSPVNLGSSINSSGNESYPFVKDGVLYFSSDGHLGLGGLDVFSSKINGNSYSSPENLGRPYNSRVDDFSYLINTKGEEYLISNRGLQYGIDQVYKVAIADFLVEINLGSLTREELESIMVFKSNGEEIKNFTIEGNILKFKTDGPDDFVVTKKGSLPEVFRVTENDFKKGSGKSFNASFRALTKIALFEDIIYFDFNKSEVRSVDLPVLNRIKGYMERSKYINLDVAAHTDSKASYEYNLQLSERRAKSVGNHFQTFGSSSSSFTTPTGGVENVKDLDGLFYTVQIFAGSEDAVTKVRVDGVPTQYERIPNNVFRVSKGRFNTANEAINYSRSLISKGFSDAFPVAYYNGERYTLKDASKLNKRDFSRSSMIGETNGSNVAINKSRINLQWFGKQSPFIDCDNCDDKAHQLNRRAELKLYLNNEFDFSSLPVKDLVNGSVNEDALVKILRRNLLNIQD
jgi:outer membrane protein OmpA-like peptidoglycan-associated protein